MRVCHADRVLDGSQRYCRRSRADLRSGPPSHKGHDVHDQVKGRRYYKRSRADLRGGLRSPKDHGVRGRVRGRRCCKRNKADPHDVPQSPSDHDNHVQVKDRNHYHRLAHYDVALHGAPSEVHDALANVLAEVSFQAFVAEPFGGDGLCHDGLMDRIFVRFVNVPSLQTNCP